MQPSRLASNRARGGLSRVVASRPSRFDELRIQHDLRQGRAQFVRHRRSKVHAQPTEPVTAPGKPHRREHREQCHRRQQHDHRPSRRAEHCRTQRLLGRRGEISDDRRRVLTAIILQRLLVPGRGRAKMCKRFVVCRAHIDSDDRIVPGRIEQRSRQQIRERCVDVREDLLRH